MEEGDKGRKWEGKKFPRIGRNLDYCSTGLREHHSPLAQLFTPTSQCTQPGIFEVCSFGIEMAPVAEDSSELNMKDVSL